MHSGFWGVLRFFNCFALVQSTAAAFGSRAYLESLSAQPTEMSNVEVEKFLGENEAPDEFYGKHNPMASWEGWKHPRWGAYLDNLGEDNGALEKNEQDIQPSVEKTFR